MSSSAAYGERIRLARPVGPSGVPRLLAAVREDGRPDSLRAHLDRHGPLQEGARGAELISIVEASGLTGRGGGGFPAGAKLRAVAEHGGRRRPVVLVNGAEGEPASGKDRALLQAVPHLVLDGAVLAAEAVGAREVVVAVGARAMPAKAAVAGAISERKGDRVRASITLTSAPSGFVTGEETALIRFLNGGPAKPTSIPPRPFERGVRGAPTLVFNVETCANLALVARYGSDWFRELGTMREPGSTLVTITGAVARPGVHEIGLGTRFATLVDEAGGFTEPVGAFLVGGYFGSWLPADTALGLQLLDTDLAPHGASLGARAIVALPAHVCAVHEVARVARYLADESAGQCGPCVHGLAAIAEGIEHVAAGKGDDRARLSRWTESVRGRGGCRHPDGATRFVASALDVFAEEVELHLRRGRCRVRSRPFLPIPSGGGRR